MISRQEINKIAKNAMLDLKEDELDRLEIKLNQSLDSIKLLDQLDTDGVEPLYHVRDGAEAFREDELREDMNLSREEALKNTSEEQYGYFKLLNIMD